VLFPLNDVVSAVHGAGRRSACADVQRAIDFVLSHDVTGICTAGDTRLLPLVLEACERFAPMAAQAREALIAEASAHEPLFA
jgi:hypothetical protein